MHIFLKVLTGAAILAASVSSAQAEMGGEFSFWGMGVIPSGSTAGSMTGTACTSGGNSQLCSSVFGYGAAANVYVPVSQNLSFSFDLLHESHKHTDSNFDSATQPALAAASYTSFGVHMVNETNADMPWGGFAFVTNSTFNGSNDPNLPHVGGG